MTDQELNEAVARKMGMAEVIVKNQPTIVPDYCHDIKAAFEIDAWVKREHPDWQFSVYRVKDDFACVIGTADKHYADYADTAPRAIVMAFLKVT